jgi:Ca2+-binding RTX toxin-like protein
MLVALVAVGGVALAQTLDGGPGGNRLIGSDNRDQIDGNGGEDVIKGLRSRDALNGGAGDDTIYAGPRDESALDTVNGGGGDDVIRVFNRPAAKDVVDCGPGRDRIVADHKDVFSSC